MEHKADLLEAVMGLRDLFPGGWAAWGCVSELVGCEDGIHIARTCYEILLKPRAAMRWLLLTLGTEAVELHTAIVTHGPNIGKGEVGNIVLQPSLLMVER